MKAVKCDRCQRFFTEEIMMISYEYPDDSQHKYECDICPDCFHEFVEFMKEGKVGNDN